MIALSLIVHGRLVYPQFGMHVTSPDVASLIVAIYYGGMHAVGPALMLLSEVFAAAWFVAVGARLYAIARTATGMTASLRSSIRRRRSGHHS